MLAGPFLDGGQELTGDVGSIDCLEEPEECYVFLVHAIVVVIEDRSHASDDVTTIPGEEELGLGRLCLPRRTGVS